MPTRKRKSKKKFQKNERKRDVLKCLKSRDRPSNEVVARYAKRYGVEPVSARTELIEIGFWEEIFTEEMEKQGKEVEYIMNPLSGELVLVEAGTEEHELFM